ncbi:MAG TPA: glycosyltransferase family 4 protein [Candidatus Binataceae bacterium]
MRIALLTRRFDPHGGGTERDLIVTAEFLARAGHEITIYAAEIRKPSAQWKVRRVGPRLPLGRAVSLMRFAYGAARMARRDGAELVVSFARALDADVLRSGGSAHASYLRAARKWRGRTGTATMRLTPYHQAQMLIERRAFTSPRLKAAVAVSTLVRYELIREFGLAPERTVTIYNGVDLDRFRPAADNTDREMVRAHYRIPADARVVIFVGNGFARKGLGALIDAWPSLAGEPYLLVVGSDNASATYGNRAYQLGVTQRVVFAGAQPNVEALFHAADAFAMPSMFEPFGNVVMEAMASGLPVLTSEQSGVQELVPREMRPFVVENPDDPSEVALRLGLLLDSRESLGTLARAAAEQHPWDRYGKELVALIDSLA